MGKVLAIETATESCSVALLEGSKVLTSYTEVQANIHASKLHVFIDLLMKEAGLSFEQLDAIAVSKGPGSYTGLRIGVAAAKGLCFALDKPLIAIGTLEAMAFGLHHAALLKGQSFSKPILYCPMIDARRMEVYSAFYDADLQEQKPVSADVLDDASYASYFERYQLVFFGNGAAKCQALSRFATDGYFVADRHPRAEDMALLIDKKYAGAQFESLINFEPFYLKDFVAGVKKSR